MLIVAHAAARGTKRVITDAIYDSGADNLASTHKDFESLGLAVDLAVLDRPMTAEQIAAFIDEAGRVTGRADAIRSVRQVLLSR